MKASARFVFRIVHIGVLLSFTATLLLAAGCGDDEDGPPSVSVGEHCIALTPCDIRESDCQAAVFNATACQRGQSTAVQPPVFTVDEDEAFAVVTASDDPEQGPDDIESAWSVGLALLGLSAPPSPSGDIDISRELLKDVAAFYTPSSKEIYVIDRDEEGDIEDGMFILSHEFVHSLQDQAQDLTAFRKKHVDSSDAHLATTAVIEGEATVLSTAVLLGMLGRDVKLIDWQAMGDNFIDDAFEGASVSDAPFFSLFQGLPYGLGVQRMGPLWANQGQAGTNSLFGAPPLTVGDWPNSDGPATDHALRCLPTTAPTGHEIVSVDRFGPTGVAAATLVQGVDPSTSWTFDWRDDLVVLFMPSVSTASDTPVVAITWRTRFVDALMAQQFAADLMGSASVQAMSVVVDEDEVLVFGSNDPVLLKSWRPTECGTEADLTSQQQSDMMSTRNRHIGQSRPDIHTVLLNF